MSIEKRIADLLEENKFVERQLNLKEKQLAEISRDINYLTIANVKTERKMKQCQTQRSKSWTVF